MPPKLEVSGIQGQAILAAKAKMSSALDLFRPQPHQEEFFRKFSLDMILETALGGGNRAGKSLCAVAAMCAVILNKPITFRDGTKVYMRPERWREEALKIWIVGFDWDHIGTTIYRLMFDKGAFRIIRDQATGKWRAWNPDLKEDRVLKKQTKPAPPFIRVQDIIGGENGQSWENKKERQISSFECVHDETRVEFYPSTGAKPQGDPAHVIWLDEKINDESWYSELLARLMDHEGRLLWTMWPDTAPSANMTELCERAIVQEDTEDQTTFAFTFKGADNAYTKGKHRDKILETMDEETRAARDEGRSSGDRWKTYARFSEFVHRVMTDNPEYDDELAKAVRKANGIPADWTRYMILDPGTQRAGVLFVAIPPPKFGDYLVPYDELYVPRTSAKPLAEACAAKCRGVVIEDIISDSHAARQTPMGFSGTVGQNYEKEFAAAGLSSRRRGSRLSYGSDDVDSRIMRAQGTLNVRGDGSVRLRVLDCPQFVKQMKHYKWGMDPRGNPTNKPAKYQKIDLAQCFEYLISRDDCGYVRPPAIATVSPNTHDEVLKKFQVFMGITNAPADKSVYCGAGARPSF